MDLIGFNPDPYWCTMAPLLSLKKWHFIAISFSNLRNFFWKANTIHMISIFNMLFLFICSVWNVSRLHNRILGLNPPGVFSEVFITWRHMLWLIHLVSIVTLQLSQTLYIFKMCISAWHAYNTTHESFLERRLYEYAWRGACVYEHLSVYMGRSSVWFSLNVLQDFSCIMVQATL